MAMTRNHQQVSPYAPTVVVAGHVCLDVIPRFPSAGHFDLRPSHLVEVGPAIFSGGGVVSNTGLALHRLGVATRLDGKVGRDAFGRILTEIIAGHGVELARGLHADPQASTSYTIIISPPGVDRSFLHCAGANDLFGPEDIDWATVAEAKLFHFGYPPLMRRMYADGGEALVEIFRRARATGATTSLDTTLPDPQSASGQADWPAILAAALPYVDLFLPSIEELLLMLRRDTYTALCQEAAGGSLLPLVTPELLHDLGTQLLALGVRIVVLKLGNRGLYLRTGFQADLEAMGRGAPLDARQWADKELWAPCFAVDVAGTTGAGDTTIAGFLAGLLRGMPPEEAITAAVAVGACCCEAADALSGVRSWEATLARVAVGWPRGHVVVDAPGWRFDPEKQLWVGEGS